MDRNPLAMRGSRYIDPDRAYALLALREIFGVDLDKPFENLSQKQQAVILKGNDLEKMLVDSVVLGRPEVNALVSTGRD